MFHFIPSHRGISILASITTALLAQSAIAAHLHVAPSGNDTSGDGSPAKPFASPARALTAARADKSTVMMSALQRMLVQIHVAAVYDYLSPPQKVDAIEKASAPGIWCRFIYHLV